MPDSYPIEQFSATDNQHMMYPNGIPNGDVMLGVYAVEEWLTSNIIKNRAIENKSTVQVDVTWLIPVSFNLAEFAVEQKENKEGYTFTFFSANRVILQSENGFVKITSGRGKIEVENVGDPKFVKEWVAHFDSIFKRAENLIEWVYSGRGDSISVPLNYRPAIKAAYPWIKKDINDYIDDYLNSDASVIILIGPPGTGKTTFIKNLIHRSGADAKVAYDEKVMGDDALFANFIDDESRFMIMEDSDAFLQSRTDGNTMMHKFLNVSDGLISSADKKLVFSTNLPNIADIDPALMRPGRCFDVVSFRALTVEEAEDVIDEVGAGVIPEGKTKVTLAELFSQQACDGYKPKRGIGFTV